MSTWRYIGCNTKQLPKELREMKLLDVNQIKELLGTIPIVEGYLEAVHEEAVVALLINDGIMPLKLHKMTSKELKVERLKTLAQRTKKKLHNIS